MSARVSSAIHINGKHARAICDEIGERLRETLERTMPHHLPPRLQELIDLLVAADRISAPSIVPSLDEVPSAAIPEASSTTT